MNKRSTQDQASSQKFQGSRVVAYDLPSRTLVYIFSFCIHHPLNTWSTQVTIQYSSLEDKEIMKILAIYCHQGSTVVTRHSSRHFSVPRCSPGLLWGKGGREKDQRCRGPIQSMENRLIKLLPPPPTPPLPPTVPLCMINN